MDLNAQKEEFSRAFVKAVAAVSGFATYTLSVDDDSVDLGIALRGGNGGRRSPRLEIQLKCSADTPAHGSTFPFEIKTKNYDDLRPTDLVVPRALFLVIVPARLEAWMESSETQAILRHAGYWVSLRAMPETKNTTTVTVHIPRSQRLTPKELTAAMNRIGTQGYP